MHDLQTRAPDASDYVFVDATKSLQGGAIPQTTFPPYGFGLLLKEGESKLLHIEAQNSGSNAFAGIPFQIMWAAALTSYMFKSESVKLTFVNTYYDQLGVHDREESEIAENIE